MIIDAFRHCFSLDPPGMQGDEELRLISGLNHFRLRMKAGAEVGTLILNQLSIQILGGKLDLLSEKWPQSSLGKRPLRYSVITQPHSFTIKPDQPLWAGFSQEITLAIFTGSHHINKVSCIIIWSFSNLI